MVAGGEFLSERVVIEHYSKEDKNIVLVEFFLPAFIGARIPRLRRIQNQACVVIYNKNISIILFKAIFIYKILHGD